MPFVLSIPMAGQGSTPTCPAEYSMQTGANGVGYCLLTGVPSISTRKPDDGASFSLACDTDSICIVSDEITVRDPRLNGGYEFSFTRQLAWQDTEVDDIFRGVRGAVGRALFADGGACGVVSLSTRGTLPAGRLNCGRCGRRCSSWPRLAGCRRSGAAGAPVPMT